MKLIRNIAIVISGLTIITSCGSSPKSKSNELINADRAFSAYSETYGYGKAFIHFADTKAVLLRNNKYPILGIERISELFKDVNDSLIILSWEPSEAFVASSNDFGYTYGIYSVTNRSNADSLIGSGTYVSVWKKNKNDEWKWALDCGTDGLPDVKD